MIEERLDGTAREEGERVSSPPRGTPPSRSEQDRAPGQRLELVKSIGRLIWHARYFILPLAESHLTLRLLRKILGRIGPLARTPTEPDRRPGGDAPDGGRRGSGF